MLDASMPDVHSPSYTALDLAATATRGAVLLTTVSSLFTDIVSAPYACRVLSGSAAASAAALADYKQAIGTLTRNYILCSYLT